MISVVDYIADDSGEKLVVWAIQPRIDVSTDVLCGAWILGADEANPLSALSQVVADTTVILLNPAAQDLLPENISRTSVTAISEGMQQACQEYLDAAKEAKLQAEAEKRSFTVPKIAKVEVADPQDFQDGYHGEPVAQNAWLVAQVLVDLVHQWKAIESARRGRKALKEAFGAQPLPLPTPALQAE